MSHSFHLEIDEKGVATLTFDQPEEKVNTLSPSRLKELSTIIDQAEANSKIKVLVIRSAKRGVFIAGADLKVFSALFEDPSMAEDLICNGHKLFNRLAKLPFPTVALIEGVCLGGGLELALACNYRVVTDNPKTSLGLPEVTLGIMPGWGGTKRLPSLIGIQKALTMILTGKALDAKKSYNEKLADAIFPQEFVQEKLADFLNKISTEKGRREIEKGREKKGIAHTLLEKNPLGRALLFAMAEKNVRQKTNGHYPAPLVALNTIKKSCQKSLQEGLEIEIDSFLEATHKEFTLAVNLINLFFANEELKKDPGVELNSAPKEVRFAGVIGAGTMGAPIAWLFSKQMIPVRIKDISWQAISKGYASAYSIYKSLLAKRRIKPHEVERMFQMISASTDYSGFERSDIVIEAATENLELKEKIFAELEELLPQETIIASNTSSLPIAEMTKKMKHPERFLGMHFFNPPNKMPLVEIIPGEKTSDEAIATAIALCKRFKKVPLVVKDCPGFLVNRIFAMAGNEASWMLQEGVEIGRLEKIITDFGMPMGPCTLADEIGIDVGHKVFSVFEKSYGARMTSPKITEELYKAGFYGKKSGKGYFLYNKGKKGNINPKVLSLLKKFTNTRHTLSDEEILQRFVMSMINEAARCLEENVVKSPLHLDMGLVYGLGFPPFRTGLLYYADSLGIEKVAETLQQLSERYGERFTPCKAINELREKKMGFYQWDKEKNGSKNDLTEEKKKLSLATSGKH